MKKITYDDIEPWDYIIWEYHDEDGNKQKIALGVPGKKDKKGKQIFMWMELPERRIEND